MLASQTLTPGAADAVSTGGTLGLYTQLDARAPVASDMVASPETDVVAWIYDQRLPMNDFRLTTKQGMPMAFAHQYGATATKPLLPPPKSLFKPRSGVGYALWKADMTNRLATSRLVDTSTQPPPSFEDAVASFPYKSQYEQYDLWMAALSEYREENTEIYNIIMATIDLSGNREETDVEHLARHYHHGIHRDGRGLAGWIDGLNDLSQVGEQDWLQTRLADAKLVTPPAQVTVPILEKHCTDLLSLWKKIVGNDVSAPASFNSRLLSSIPQGCTGVLGSLRSWLADKITDRAYFLSEPTLLIDALIAHARTLGMPYEGGASSERDRVFALLKNDCKYCAARVCTAGEKKTKCLSFNPSKPVPADASDGERNFISVSRAYVAAYNPDSLRGLSLNDMKEKIKTKQPGSTQAGLKSSNTATPIITNQGEFDTWFRSMMPDLPHGSKVVNVVAPRDGEGGLCMGLGGQFAADDIPLGDKVVVNMVTPRSLGSPLSVMRASRPHLRSSLASDAGSGTPLLPDFSVSPIVDAPSARAPLPPIVPPRLTGNISSLRAALGVIADTILRSSTDDRKHALLMLLLGVIAARHFSSPIASVLASRWARIRAAVLRLVLRIVHALGVGATRISMAASAAEPQLVAAVASV